jgi:hypothetical protein
MRSSRERSVLNFHTGCQPGRDVVLLGPESRGSPSGYGVLLGSCSRVANRVPLTELLR